MRVYSKSMAKPKARKLMMIQNSTLIDGQLEKKIIAHRNISLAFCDLTKFYFNHIIIFRDWIVIIYAKLLDILLYKFVIRK